MAKTVNLLVEFDRSHTSFHKLYISKDAHPWPPPSILKFDQRLVRIFNNILLLMHSMISNSTSNFLGLKVKKHTDSIANVLKDFYLNNISVSKEEAIDIFRKTIDQSSSQVWFYARKSWVTDLKALKKRAKFGQPYSILKMLLRCYPHSKFVF